MKLLDRERKKKKDVKKGDKIEAAESEDKMEDPSELVVRDINVYWVWGCHIGESKDSGFLGCWMEATGCSRTLVRVPCYTTSLPKVCNLHMNN
jgi:hypothetical protein